MLVLSRAAIAVSPPAPGRERDSRGWTRCCRRKRRRHAIEEKGATTARSTTMTTEVASAGVASSLSLSSTKRCDERLPRHSLSPPLHLVGICRMSACWPEVQNVRHEMSGPTCRRNVGRHVGNMVQKHVAKGTDMTHPNVGFCDMSVPCWQMHKT
jgi:hypothetical protein